MSGRKFRKQKITEKVHERNKFNRYVKLSDKFGDIFIEEKEISVFVDGFINRPLWFDACPMLSDALNNLPLDTHRPQRLCLLLAFFLRCMRCVGRIMLRDSEANYKDMSKIS